MCLISAAADRLHSKVVEGDSEFPAVAAAGAALGSTRWKMFARTGFTRWVPHDSRRRQQT